MASRRHLGRLVLGVLALAYPVLVYLGLTRFDARSVGAAAVLVMGIVLLLRMRGSAAGRVGQALLPTVPPIVLGLGTVALDEPRLLLWIPVLISLSLLASFGLSLRAGATPMVERFARLSDPELPPIAVTHCRQVSIAWCVFFVLNAATAASLALWGSYGAWALYSGAIAYALMGLMFAGELLVRTIRMRSVHRRDGKPPR